MVSRFVSFLIRLCCFCFVLFYFLLYLYFYLSIYLVFFLL